MSAELLERYRALVAVDDNGDAAAKKRRGYEFERFLHALLLGEKLDPRTRYRPEGEEIDGSFLFDGRIFLLEAKWEADSLPASKLYSFKGKVDGKLVGTLGIFVSMSGYSADAINALTLGKELNILLFDHADIHAVAEGDVTFSSLLRKKLRAAAEEAVIYLPGRTTEVRAQTRANQMATISANSVNIDDTTSTTTSRNLIILCEGPSDEVVLRTLVSRILGSNSASARVRIVAAGGKVALPRIGNALYSLVEPGVKFIFVVDSDGDIRATEHLIHSESLIPDPQIVAVHPEIEAWLPPFKIEAKEFRRRRDRSKYEELAGTVDIDSLASKDVAFRKFRQLLIKDTVDDE